MSRIKKLFEAKDRPGGRPDKIYVTVDDRHNEPYIQGPYTHEELLERFFEEDDWETADEELFGVDGFGEAETSNDDTLRIVTEETARNEIKRWNKIAEAIRTGQKLP